MSIERVFLFLNKRPAIFYVPSLKKKNTRSTDIFGDKIAYLVQYQTFFVPKMSVERVFLFLNK